MPILVKRDVFIAWKNPAQIRPIFQTFINGAWTINLNSGSSLKVTRIHSFANIVLPQILANT